MRGRLDKESKSLDTSMPRILGPSLTMTELGNL